MSLKAEAKMRHLLETMARMDIPEEDPEDGYAELDDDTLCSSAMALYALIVQARAILEEKDNA